MPDAHRSFRLGVAGPVGTGKSSLIATVCRSLAVELRLGVVTNDIYTDEDARFLRAEGVLDADRIVAVETGACPHTAIRDDVTANLIAVETLESDHYPLDVVLVESGGDNLTATFSPALVDAQIFVLDVAGGGDVARKGRPGRSCRPAGREQDRPGAVRRRGRRRDGPGRRVGARRPARDRAFPHRPCCGRAPGGLGPALRGTTRKRCSHAQ